MVNWRELRVIFLLALLMQGVLVAAVVARTSDSEKSAAPKVTEVTAKPRIQGAISAKKPVANPVLHIHQPPVSIFAPQA